MLRVWDSAALNTLWSKNCQEHARKAQLRVELLVARDLAKVDLDPFFRIVEHTSGDHYRRSSIRWNPISKREEMADPAMIYIAIRADPSTNVYFADDLKTDIIGFASFMFTHDDPPHQDRAVAYVYEIHISENFRGQKIGRFLMATVEQMANGAGVTKAMLTVFTRNKEAVMVYRKLGYIEDAASPSRQTRAGVSKYDYMIMSKDWVETVQDTTCRSEDSGVVRKTATASTIVKLTD